MVEAQIPQNIYHAHLDVCEQCRNNPFGLCPAGAIALRQAVDELSFDAQKPANPDDYCIHKIPKWLDCVVCKTKEDKHGR